MSLKLFALVGCIATVFAQQDSSSVNGIVLTSKNTNTVVEKSTSFVPVTTAVVQTSTDVNVNTMRTTLSETTDFGRTPVNTVYSKTSNVNLQSGYAYTTNGQGKTIATYTGTTTGGSSSASSSSSAGGVAPAATAAPFLGAAVLAGVAAFVV